MPIARPSIDRVTKNTTENLLPRKAANAWKPSRDVAVSEGVDADKIRHEVFNFFYILINFLNILENQKGSSRFT